MNKQMCCSNNFSFDFVACFISMLIIYHFLKFGLIPVLHTVCNNAYDEGDTE